MTLMKKLPGTNYPTNTVVHIVMRSEEEGDKEEYECVGVLMKDDKDELRVAFNAIDDKVKDDLTIKRSEILDTGVIDPSQIKSL